MIDVFSANSANDVWIQIVEKFRLGKNARSQESRAGRTKEILHVGFSIDNPRQRWVVSRFPTLNPAFAIAEVVWILTGRNDAAFLNYWNRQLPKFAGICTEYHGAYGFRLRQHFNTDQLERAYQVLRTNPESRQVVLQIWDPRIDMPRPDGKPASDDIPCNVMSLLKVRENRLEWLQILRSNDVFLGVPYNFVQFTYLQEVLAGWLGLELGSYDQISDSLHVYDMAMKEVLSSSRIEPALNTDALVEPRKISEQLFRDLGERIGKIARKDATREELLAVMKWPQAPVAYKNMLRVVVAEAARRNKMRDLAQEIMQSCTNPAFTQLWERWFTRKKKRPDLVT